MFKELFSNPDFQPDLLKIYPCALVKEAPLYRLWKKGKYKPYTEKQMINLVRSIKNIVPHYVRIQRITRDIPSHSIVAGPAKISNLRQLVSGNCKCIRCREVGQNYDQKEKLCLFRQDYEASGGKEIFLSLCTRGASALGRENSPGRLYSLLRLRITSQNKAVIREIHTYGQLHPLNYGGVNYGGFASIVSPQHKGLGKRLIKEAERITKKEFGLNKISVISGVGARDYYRKLGYGLQNTYMIKMI
ncbi:MAG: GNAT family N-acetyltransferase [Candidatus Nealsonbacteria bacterium]|nr:GNAT family N-acetyltransferase [Candidatus Nealsonbacteria bacterium]